MARADIPWKPCTRVTLLLLLLCGCASSNGWWQARVRDVTDCARLGVAGGIGLYGEVQLTSALHGAVGIADASLVPAYSAGWDPRPGQPPGRVRSAAFPLLLVGWPLYAREQVDLGLGDTHPYRRSILAPLFLMGNHHVEGEAVSLLGLHRLVPNPLLVEAPSLTALTPRQRLSRDAWFAVSGTVGVLSIDGGINPLEILDLIVGFLGRDLLADDNRGESGGESAELLATDERAR